LKCLPMVVFFSLVRLRMERSSPFFFPFPFLLTLLHTHPPNSGRGAFLLIFRFSWARKVPFLSPFFPSLAFLFSPLVHRARPVPPFFLPFFKNVTGRKEPPFFSILYGTGGSPACWNSLSGTGSLFPPPFFSFSSSSVPLFF